MWPKPKSLVTDRRQSVQYTQPLIPYLNHFSNTLRCRVWDLFRVEHHLALVVPGCIMGAMGAVGAMGASFGKWTRLSWIRGIANVDHVIRVQGTSQSPNCPALTAIGRFMTN